MADLPNNVPTGLFGGAGSGKYIGLGVFARLGGSISQAEAAAAQGAYAAAQERTNAKLAEMSATDALFNGDWEANQIGKHGRAVAGAQLASSGGQGVTAGSMAPTVAATNAAAATDSLMARFNGYNKAFGYKMEAVQERSKADFTDLATKTNTFNTLATGGLQAIEGGLSDYLNTQRTGLRGSSSGMAMR